MKGIDDEAGRFRTAEVRIAGADLMPPPAYEAPHLVKELVDWYNRNPDELRPIELSAILHYQLVWIHPFHNGNRRFARLLMNLALLRSGYPIAVILNVDRAKYYETLKKADGADKAPFVDFEVIRDCGSGVSPSLVYDDSLYEGYPLILDYVERYKPRTAHWRLFGKDAAKLTETDLKWIRERTEQAKWKIRFKLHGNSRRHLHIRERFSR
jgi:hypothetical protein